MNNPEIIKIKWNGQYQSMRKGAKVYHLLTEKEYDYCQQGKAVIRDENGYEIGLSGTLYADEELELIYLSDKN